MKRTSGRAKKIWDYISLKPARDPLVVRRRGREVREVDFYCDRLWMAKIRKPDHGWIRAEGGQKGCPDLWLEASVASRLRGLGWEVAEFSCRDIEGAPVPETVAFSCDHELCRILPCRGPDGKKCLPQKVRALTAAEYLSKNQPKVAHGGLMLGDFLIREDIWKKSRLELHFSGRLSLVDVTRGTEKRLAPKLEKPRHDLTAECRRLGIVAAKRTAYPWSAKPWVAEIVRQFFGLVDSTKHEWAFSTRSGSIFQFQGFMRPTDRAFAGQALKDFRCEDNTPAPGRMVVIGTTGTGDALTLNASSGTGEVHWFDHETGEFELLEPHLATFLAKCRKKRGTA